MGTGIILCWKAPSVARILEQIKSVKMRGFKRIFFIVIFAGCYGSLANCQAVNTQNMQTSELNNALEKGFEQIIQYHIEKGELHQRAAMELRAFARYLLSQTEYTKQRLEDIIKKINYETITRNEENGAWAELEFWRDTDDYRTQVGLSYAGEIDILSDQEPVVLARYEVEHEPKSDSERINDVREKKSIKIDLKKYPISTLGHYEFKFDPTALYYAWIGYLWQEIEGYQCGISARIVQNNSMVTYSLNDYLDGDFTAFEPGDTDNKPSRLNSFFPRKLSLIELYLRASQVGYPFNPYKNYWRYFEKGDEFIEIVTYEFTTGLRSGKLKNRNVEQIDAVVRHKDLRLALKHITEFTNQRILEGWEEKMRPLDMPSKMHGYAFDFDILSGIYNSEEQTKILPEQRVKSFEDQFNVKLPKSFFHYIRLLNGRQHHSENMHFPINDLYTVNVEKFYTIGELENVARATIQKDPNHLWIGELGNNKKLGIVINPQIDNYGKVVLGENGKIAMCDYLFEVFAKYAQEIPKQPELFAAEENDVAFLKKRLSEGWDYNSVYSYQDAVSQAAQYNSHEALELLLKAGARLKHKDYKMMTYAYDAKTMEILDKYHKD